MSAKDLKKSATKTVPEQLSDQLLNEEKTVGWIAELTGQSEASVRIRLRKEFDSPGRNVCLAFGRAGLRPHKWTEGVARFYEYTDSFLYELVIWNLNKTKQGMRSWVMDYLANSKGGGLNLLTIGDGLGLESAYLAKAGHKVTYFEVPGYTESFARKVFAECGAKPTVLTDRREIAADAYDVVICLDVLEHVPNPPTFVEMISGCLRPEGLLIVQAPFWQICNHIPTHLKTNRKYSGLLSLYKKHKLELIAGRPGWNPIVLKKMTNHSSAGSGFDPWLSFLKLAGVYWSFGRVSWAPFWWVKRFGQKGNRWFDA